MNSLPFGQLKSFLKILIGVQYKLYMISPKDASTGGSEILLPPVPGILDKCNAAQFVSLFQDLPEIARPVLFSRIPCSGDGRWRMPGKQIPTAGTGRQSGR